MVPPRPGVHALGEVMSLKVVSSLDQAILEKNDERAPSRGLWVSRHHIWNGMILTLIGLIMIQGS